MSSVIESPLADLVATSQPHAMGTPSVDKMVRAVRQHLGMDVAFVSEFRTDDRIFRHVDAKQRSPIAAGDALSLEEGYCQRVVDGRLPELIVDTQDCPGALALPATVAIPIGSHLSVPIRLADGSCYGTFCCFSFDADRSLGPRDLQIMRVFAELLADQIDCDAERTKHQAERERRIRAAMSENRIATVYQPIYDLDFNRIAGFESLSRFQADPVRPPNEWFSEAYEVGLGMELEVAAIRVALRGLEFLRLPLYSPVWRLHVDCARNTVTWDFLVGKYI